MSPPPDGSSACRVREGSGKGYLDGQTTYAIDLQEPPRNGGGERRMDGKAKARATARKGLHMVHQIFISQ